MRTLTKEMQAAITPELALTLLEEGNKRFIGNLKVNRNLLQQANDTSDGQHPFAVILSCMDSRTSVELIFDQGLGDVFSIRIAGNIVNEDVLASLEFACKVVGVKIIVVLGHTKCGAIKGACDGVELGHLTTLLEKIKPAIQAETATVENRTANNELFVDRVTANHIAQTVDDIVHRSPILRELVQAGQCGLVGGLHDISTGKVDFYPHTKLGFFKHNTPSGATHPAASHLPRSKL